MDYEERKLLAHLKIADRNRARYALILGSDELAAGELVLRDLEDRTDRRVALGRASRRCGRPRRSGAVMAFERRIRDAYVRELLEIMHEHDLDRIKVKLGDAVYELVRREAGAQIVAPAFGSSGPAVPPASDGASAPCAVERQAGDRAVDRRLLSLVLARCRTVRRTSATGSRTASVLCISKR